MIIFQLPAFPDLNNFCNKHLYTKLLSHFRAVHIYETRNAKLMVKIASIFGSVIQVVKNSMAGIASWNLYIPRVAESKSKCSSSRQV